MFTAMPQILFCAKQSRKQYSGRNQTLFMMKEICAVKIGLGCCDMILLYCIVLLQQSDQVDPK
jgi:hypothetical protein